MKCLACGATVTDTRAIYCPSCGEQIRMPGPHFHARWSARDSPSFTGSAGNDEEVVETWTEALLFLAQIVFESGDEYRRYWHNPRSMQLIARAWRGKAPERPWARLLDELRGALDKEPSFFEHHVQIAVVNEIGHVTRDFRFSVRPCERAICRPGNVRENRKRLDHLDEA